MKWYEQVPERLLREREIMSESFPQARLVKLSDGRLAWVLALRTNSGRTYVVNITYSNGFPLEYPQVFVVDPPIVASPHQYAGGRLCLFSTADRPERSYTVKTTAATIASWAAAWLASYEIWRVTSRWPERNVE